jgi:hypothetical protein
MTGKPTIKIKKTTSRDLVASERRGPRKTVRIKANGHKQVKPEGWHPEQALISSVITNNEVLIAIERGVVAGWFHAYRLEWEFVQRYFERHKKSPPKSSFRRKFPDFEFVPAEDVAPLIDECRDGHAKHTLLVTVRDLTESIRSDRDPMIIMKEAERALIGLHSEVQGTANSAEITEDWEQAYREVTNRVTRAGTTGQAGIPTGYPTLDKATGGINSGEFWIVAARLGQGKTWTLVNMATHALIAGKTVLYVALEGSRSAIHMRSHNLLSAMYSKEVFKSIDLMRGTGVDLLEYKKFLKSLSRNLTGKFIVDDTPPSRVNPLTVAAMIERYNPDVTYLDYIQKMDNGGGDWQSMTALSAQMQDVAVRYDQPIVAASQINRTGGIGNDPPGAEHLAGSDSLGRDIDALVTQKSLSTRVSRMRLAKYRHGPDNQKWWAVRDLDKGRIFEATSEDAADYLDEDRQDEDDRDAGEDD